MPEDSLPNCSFIFQDKYICWKSDLWETLKSHDANPLSVVGNQQDSIPVLGKGVAYLLIYHT